MQSLVGITHKDYLLVAATNSTQSQPDLRPKRAMI